MGRKPGTGNMNLAKVNPATRAGFGEKEEDKVLIKKLLGETVKSYKLPRVKSDQEIIDRLDFFFDECVRMAKIPTVEEMVMSLGYTYHGVNEIELGRNPGFSPETKNILKRAKEVIKTFDAKLAVSGELNPVLYFFRAKNYYGMRDQQEIVVQGKAERVQDMSDDEIAKWYLEDGKTVEGEFVDEGKAGGDDVRKTDGL